MRTLCCLVFAACVGTADAPSDSAAAIDSDPPIDPCTEAPQLAEWARALVSVDGSTVHDFRAGVNEAVLVELDGSLAARASEDCPGGFAVERDDGSVVEVDLCIDDGPQLDTLPADGRAVTGRFEGLDTTRGEFTLVLADADGLLLSMRIDGQGDSRAEPWRVAPEADILVCLDGDAFQSLRFSHGEESAVIDSGGAASLEAGGHSWSLRAHIAGRQAQAERHLLDWGGAIYTIRRE